MLLHVFIDFSSDKLSLPSAVCKKTCKVPEKGEERVRVCDVCFDQIERGDPVCISKQVALMRSSSERDRQAGAKALADWASMDPQFADGGVVSAVEALRLVDLLGSLLLEGGAQTQAAAARLLSAMMQYPKHAEALQQAALATTHAFVHTAMRSLPLLPFLSHSLAVLMPALI
ncbi:MAG: hypothetical protein SGPRY_010230 [Prymnesium sp.]